MDKTPVVARYQISNMATGQPRMVNEIGVVDNLRLESQLTELTSLVRQLAVGQHQPSIVARVCGICTSVEHPTDMCPTLQEIESNHPESVGAIGGYQYRKQLTKSSSAIWTWPECTSRSSRLSTTKSVISSTTFLTTATTATKESASLRQLPISRGPDETASNKQSGVLAKYELQQHAIPAKHECHHPKPQDGNRTSAESGNLPSQTILNLRANMNVVTLRSGRELPQPASQQVLRPTDADSKPNADSRIAQQDRSVPLPFPTQTLLEKKPEFDVLKMFRKIPKYAKFLKELCVHKRKKMKGGVESRGIVSVFTRNDEFTIGVQQALPNKC
ncbi:hypothetical protein CR513_16892, partial [Mucuna pruriens]